MKMYRFAMAIAFAIAVVPAHAIEPDAPGTEQTETGPVGPAIEAWPPDDATDEPPSDTFSRRIESGETLDAVLSEAGITASDRAEVALALGAEYDLRRLRPGHRIGVSMSVDGRPRRVGLTVEDGVLIEALFGTQPRTRIVAPDPEIVSQAAEATVETSIAQALAEEGIPTRFAVDLAQMLGGTVDFRRDLDGGETLRLLWHEAKVAGERIRQPELAFAALELDGALYEIAWPEDGTGKATIYLDGEVLRVFAQPVEGARLTSVFGRRRHPVFGDVRMHTGVDFAAARGTPVQTTAPGKVAFTGWRSGYGRMVDIAHGSDTLTRYAHLSAIANDLVVGKRVVAGDVIGKVGATGTTTGPSLHYEVHVEGRPRNPLTDERLGEIIAREEDDGDRLIRLNAARSELEKRLAGAAIPKSEERL